MKNRVLIVGSDLTLLNTRRDILQVNGVLAETHLFDPAHHVDSSSDTTVVVACSSLSAEARKAVIDSAYAASPNLKCLVVVPNSVDRKVASGADAVMEALEGPEKFMSHIHDLIARPL